MRRLIFIVVLAAAAWSGYWIYGARAQTSAVETWLEERRAEGWQVEYSALDLQGYPNRFDMTMRDVELTDPETGVSWIAPFFQILALSYQPNHLIAVWPDQQTLATPEQKIDLVAEKMTASLVVKPGEDLELDRANLVVENASLTSTEGWTTRFKALTAGIRGTEGRENTYDLALSADGLVPGEAWQGMIDRSGALPDALEAVLIDIVLGFDAPLDIRTIEEARPALTAIEIKQAKAGWGELSLRAAGKVNVDATGKPDGAIDLNARNWRDMLALAVDAGAVSSDVARGAELGLGLLSNLSGSSDSLDAPLSFKDGLSFLGPIPIGKAPDLSLR
ncbi:MAG: DUF2125 domain-containing protein [Pseudomonadota bacterium]